MSNSLTTEELQAYLDFYTKKAYKDEDHKKVLESIGERTVALKDVIGVIGAIQQQDADTIERLITAHNIQEKINAMFLGITAEMKEEAANQYKEEMMNWYKEYEAALQGKIEEAVEKDELAAKRDEKEDKQ